MWILNKILKIHCFLKKKSHLLHRYKPHEARFCDARFFSGTKIRVSRGLAVSTFVEKWCHMLCYWTKGYGIFFYKKRPKLFYGVKLIFWSFVTLFFLTIFWSGAKQRFCFSERSIFQTFRKRHSCPDSLFNKLETSNFGWLLVFNFAEPCKIWGRLDKLDIRNFIRVPPLMFFYSINLPKFQRRDPYNMSYIKFL